MGISGFFRDFFSKLRSNKSFALSFSLAVLLVAVFTVGIIAGDNSCKASAPSASIISFGASAEEFASVYNESAERNGADMINSFNPGSYSLTNTGHFLYSCRCGAGLIGIYTDENGLPVQIDISADLSEDYQRLLKCASNAAFTVDSALARMLSKCFKSGSAGSFTLDGVCCSLSTEKAYAFSIYPERLGRYSDYGSGSVSDEDKARISAFLGECILYCADNGFENIADNDAAAAALTVHCALHGGEYKGVLSDTDAFLISEEIADAMLGDIYVEHGDAGGILKGNFEKRGGSRVIPKIDASPVAVELESISFLGVDANYRRASFQVSFSAESDGVLRKCSAVLTRNKQSVFGFSLLAFTEI